MKIMLAYDGSVSGKVALNLALNNAKESKNSVMIVTSFQKDSLGHDEEITEAENGLKYAQSLFKKHQIECNTHLLIRGLSPGEDLVTFAKEEEVDQIIIGIQRRSKIGKLLMGSTAQYVILNAPCPVLTVGCELPYMQSQT